MPSDPVSGGPAFDDVDLDFELPSVVHTVDQEVITRNAVASLDYNPIHIDPAWAKKIDLLGRGTTIAHGMCTFSFMTSVVTNWCAAGGGFVAGLEGGFLEPVRPGDTITSSGIISEKHPRRPGESFVVVSLTAKNQRNATVAVGSARVVLPS